MIRGGNGAREAMVVGLRGSNCELAEVPRGSEPSGSEPLGRMGPGGAEICAGEAISADVPAFTQGLEVL